MIRHACIRCTEFHPQSLVDTDMTAIGTGTALADCCCLWALREGHYNLDILSLLGASLFLSLIFLSLTLLLPSSLTYTYTHTHLQSLVLPVHVLVHQFDCMQHLVCLAPWISGHSRHRGREDVPAPSVPQTPPTSTCGLQGNKTAGGGALPV